MTFLFPLNDVDLKVVRELPSIGKCLYRDDFAEVCQNEFKLHVPKVADFYVHNGREVQICPAENAVKNTIELYLNGTILGMVLHQRGVLPLHGSSFSTAQKGFVLCGESGSGKSTLSYGICKKNNWDFHSDDITAIKVTDQIRILPVSDRVKLWTDTLEHFKIGQDETKKVRSDIAKYFVSNDRYKGGEIPLGMIIFIESGNSVNENTFEQVDGTEKFELLYRNIYRNEYLEGMPQTRVDYFSKISAICNGLPFYRFSRSEKRSIDSTLSDLQRFIQESI